MGYEKYKTNGFMASRMKMCIQILGRRSLSVVLATDRVVQLLWAVHCGLKATPPLRVMIGNKN